MNRSYGWQRFYEAAILETNRSKLPRLIATVQAAIDARLAQLKSQQDSSEERQAIADALVGLNLLRQEVPAVTPLPSPRMNAPRQ
jgi:IS5 family transposase